MAQRPRTGITSAAQSVLTDNPDFLRFIVERVIQEILEAEMTAHLHAEPYERSADRRGYRNGYKPRNLNTRVGTLTLHPPARGYPGRIATGRSAPSSSHGISAMRRRSSWH
jgi:transposase-like protein